MSRQIIKQPDGKYALFSTETRRFLLENASPVDIKKYITGIWLQVISQEIDEIVTKLDAGEKPYQDSTISWDEALKLAGRDE